MGKVYGETQVCLKNTITCLNLEPGLMDIMTQSTNFTHISELTFGRLVAKPNFISYSVHPKLFKLKWHSITI